MPHGYNQNAGTADGVASPAYHSAMNERPEDDPGADTGMFRAYAEQDQDVDDPSSFWVSPGFLAGTAVVLLIVVVVLILLLI
jgi:hypothetical protein